MLVLAPVIRISYIQPSCLLNAEQQLAALEGVESVPVPEKALEMLLEDTQSREAEIEHLQRCTVMIAHDIVKKQAHVLQYLGTRPLPGTSLHAPDGSYSISGDRLALAEADEDAASHAFDGPLKERASSVLAQLRAFRDRLTKLKSGDKGTEKRKRSPDGEDHHVDKKRTFG